MLYLALKYLANSDINFNWKMPLMLGGDCLFG